MSKTDLAFGISGFPNKEIFSLRMNLDNKNIDESTDLELSLGYSKQCTLRILSNNIGAGANAASEVDNTFVASHPLSEIVWSPRKGLSLRCADCTFADNKTSVLPGAGLSNVVPSPTKIITAKRTSYGKPIDEKNLITSQTIFEVPGDVVGRNTTTCSPSRDAEIMPARGLCHEHILGAGDIVEGTNTPVGGYLLHMEQKENDNRGLSDRRVSDLLLINNDVPEVLCGDPDGAHSVINRNNQTLGKEVVQQSHVQSLDECKAPDTNVPTLASPRRNDEEINNMITTSVLPLDRLESTAENDLQTPRSNKREIAASEFSHGIKIISQRDEEVLSVGKAVSLKHSPSNSKVQMSKRKGKRKALSDGDVHEKMLEDDSRESVESCNSAGLFGSKIAKKQVQGSPDCRSFMRRDGSFVNWITNMMKGFTKSKDDETPSLALTLASPNQTHESSDQKPTICNKDQDIGFRNMGFQSVFRSIYCSNTKVNETRVCTVDCQNREGSNDAELPNRIRNNATPIVCHAVTGSFSQEVVVSNENVEESIAVNVAGPSTKPQDSALNFAAIHENCDTTSPENKNSYSSPFVKETNGTSSKNSLAKLKTNTADHIPSDSSIPKTTSNFGYRSDLRGSLWITRFCPKNAAPLSDLATCNQSKGEALGCSTDSNNNILSKDNHRSVVKEQSPEEPLTATSNECQNCATNAEASAGFNRFSYKFNPILPSQKFKSSDIMASNFARRLDALKSVTPSDNAGHAKTTCFFCGIRGHHLRDCPDITESEVDDLLRNISSYDGAEEFPCLCIRCFQHDHWAVACSSASSRRRHVLNGGITRKGNGKNPKLLDSKESKIQAAVACTKCEGSNLRVQVDLNLNCNLKEKIRIDKMISNSSLIKRCIASSSGKNDLRENQIASLCNIVNTQSSDVPKGIFDAIKMLRLARTDILKLMNSCMSLSHLNGFFLRLRLGKWEEGLWGTGYHVACITETETARSQPNAKTPISVNIGGMKCLVESQYISNHDFLEDELMAWWCAISNSGCTMPSSEDMIAKVKERKMLGF